MTAADEVRLATADDLDPIVDTLSVAFDDDPLITWIFGDTPPRPMRFLPSFYRREAMRHLRHDHVYTVDGHLGAALWDPPGEWKTRLRDLLPGFGTILRGSGRRTIPALRGLARMEEHHERQPDDHYYLAIIGTRPECRGHGVGAALLQPVLRRCDLEGVGAYLESSKESNLAWYRRFGFERVGEVEFPGGPTMWPMWRHPQPPESGA